MATADLPQVQYKSVSEYHADYSRISNSMLKCFAGSRREYEGTYITRTRPPKRSTDSQKVGTLTHADLLGEGDLSRFVTSPFDSFRTNKAKEWRDEQLNEGKEIVTEAQLDDVKACAASVRSKIAKWLDNPCGQSETYETWHHEASGLDLRCMVDFCVELENKIVVLDLKTCADESPRGFRKACEDWDYPIQQVHYTEGLEHNHSKPVEWLFVAVRNCWPFTCRIYRIEATTIHRAYVAREKRLSDLAECYRTDDWQEPGEFEFTPIECRKFYLEAEIA